MLHYTDVELRKQGVVSFDALVFSAVGLPCTQFHLPMAARAFVFGYVLFGYVSDP